MLNFSTPKSKYLQDVLKGYEEGAEGDYQIFDEQELMKEYPMIESGGKFVGCLDKEAGFIWAERALFAARVL